MSEGGSGKRVTGRAHSRLKKEKIIGYGHDLSECLSLSPSSEPKQFIAWVTDIEIADLAVGVVRMLVSMTVGQVKRMLWTEHAALELFGESRRPFSLVTLCQSM